MRRNLRALLLLASVPAACHHAATTTPVQDTPSPYMEPPDEPFRNDRPPIGAARPFQNPEVQRFTMSDGVDVILVERHTLPEVMWQLQFPGGSATDPTGKEGRASLCGWALVQQRDDSADLLADMGSSVTESWSSETFTLNGFALRAQLDPTLAIWSEDVQMPQMQQADLDRLRRQLVGALPQALASPTTVAGRLLELAAYGPDHPYARVPTAASYAAITVDDCQQFIADTLRPRGARLLVAGDISRAEVEAKFGARLTTPITAAAVAPILPAPVRDPSRLIFADVPGASQTVIYMWSPGGKRTDPDYYAASVMASIFGGNALTSRLGVDLREMMGSTYSVSGGFSYSKTDGLLVFAAPVQTDRTQAAIATMFSDARRMRETDVTDDELSLGRDGRVAGLPAQFQTVSGTMGAFSTLAYYELPFTYYQDYAANFAMVDKAAVRKAAGDYLAADQLHFVVVGDGQTVLPMLQALTSAGDLQGASWRVVHADGTPAP